MSKRLLSALALFVVVVGFLPAFGSVFVRLDVPTLIRGADRGVIVGRVLAVRSYWNDERTMIFTDVEVFVLEDLKQRVSAGSTMTFRVPGGQVDPLRVTMPGAPDFHLGDEVAVFASTWSDGRLKVLGYRQGLSSLRIGEDGKQRLQGGSAGGLALEQLRDGVHAERAARPAGKSR